MKDSETGIKALIKNYWSDQVYRELDLQRQPHFLNDGRNECFIEGVQNEQFGFEVIVPSNFDWMGASALLVTYRLENGAVENFELLLNPDDDLQGVKKVKHCRVHVTDAGEEHWCDYVFWNPCAESDDVSVEGHDTEGQEPDHRKIEVLIQRGEYDYGKHWSQEDNSDTCDGLSDVSEMTDKFLDVDDGGAKSERPVIGSPPKKSSHSKAGRKSAPPCSSSQAALTWTPAKGAAGQQITFAFCYATRDFLETEIINPSASASAKAETNAPGVIARPVTRAITSRSSEEANMPSDSVGVAPAYNLPGRRAEPSTAGIPIPERKRKRSAMAGASGGSSKAPALTAKQLMYEHRDQDDDESLPRSRIKIEETGDLNGAVSRPSAADGAVPTTTKDSAEEEAEILERLEEIKLNRRLRELRASKK